jgi:hypothetical protein
MGILDIIRMKQESGTRKFYGVVPDQRVLEDHFTPSAITKDKSYFKISLSEMFLKDKTNYISGFVPMTVAVNRFNYNGRPHEIPVMVGNQLLSSIERYVRDQHIEFRHTPIVGPVPYTGENVSLFIGLYRVQVDNLAKTLFNLMERIISAFDLSSLSGYLKIADKVGYGLADLIGLDTIQMRLGTMDTFSGNGRGTNPLRSGYLLFVNCPENKIDVNKLWVNDGRLLEGADRAKAAPYAYHDFCLVRIEHLESRQDLDTLPFHELYRSSKAKIWEGNIPEAQRLFLSLMRDLSASPDLTPKDQANMMKTYFVNYQQEKENYTSIAGQLSGGESSATRGAEANPSQRTGRSSRALSAKAMIQKTAAVADRTNLRLEDRSAVSSSLNKLAQTLKEIPYLVKQNKPAELDSTMLCQQFNAVRTSQREAVINPKALADAITYAAFSGKGH